MNNVELASSLVRIARCLVAEELPSRVSRDVRSLKKTMIKMNDHDMAKVKSIISFVLNGSYLKAWDAVRNLDTAVCDNIGDNLWYFLLIKVKGVDYVLKQVAAGEIDPLLKEMGLR